MNRTVLSVVAALGLASGLASGQAPGQTSGQAPKKPANQPVSPTASPAASPSDPAMQLPSVTSSQPLVSVEFANGTVAQYIAALKKANPDTPINIIASDRAAKQMLGSISLKNVPVSVAAFSIRVAANSATMIWDIADIEQNIPGLTDVPVMLRTFANHAYRVDCQSSARRTDDVVVQALSLQAIVLSENSKAADAASAVALTAIQTGLALRDPENPDAADLKFHPDSGLLFVRGTRDEVQLVSQIVSRLREDAEIRRDAAERQARGDQLREIAIKDAQLEIQLRGVEYQATEQALAQVQKEFASGVAPEGDVRAAQLNFERAKLAFDRARLDQDRARVMSSSENPRAITRDVAEKNDAVTNMRVLQLETENASLRKMLQDIQSASAKGAAKTPEQHAK